MMRDYWTGFRAERERLDARKNCRTGYACGDTCIPTVKECRKNPKATIGRERLQRIRDLAAGNAAEGRGLMRLRQQEAAALADKIQGQRDEVAKVARSLRRMRRQEPETPPSSSRPTLAEMRPPIRGDRPVPGAKLAEQTFGQDGPSPARQLVTETMDALQAMPGEIGRNARQMAQILHNQGIAIVATPYKAELTELPAFLRNPKFQESLELGLAVAAQRDDMATVDWVSRTRSQLERDPDEVLTFQKRDKSGKLVDKQMTIRDKILRDFACPSFANGFTSPVFNHVVVYDKLGDYAAGRSEPLPAFKAREVSRNVAETLITRVGLTKGNILDPRAIRGYVRLMREDGATEGDFLPPVNTRGAYRDNTLSDSVSRGIGLGGRPTDAPITQAYTEQLMTFIHEVGHQVHFRGVELGMHDAVPRRVRDEGVVSNYGGQTPQERFAEAYSAYVLNPVALRATFPETYAWVKAIADKAAAI